jgi:hypothetical protein
MFRLFSRNRARPKYLVEDLFVKGGAITLKAKLEKGDMLEGELYAYMYHLSVDGIEQPKFEYQKNNELEYNIWGEGALDIINAFKKSGLLSKECEIKHNNLLSSPDLHLKEIDIPQPYAQTVTCH